jgi:pimeloyl-ACP methyl ester carboxylesterase
MKERLQDLINQGDREAVLATMFREVVGVSEEELAALRADPSWEGRLRSAHTVPREFADADHIIERARLVAFRVPTLLMVGELTPLSLTAPSHWLAANLPDARVVNLPGQAHIAMTTAPDLFVREVLSFLIQRVAV